MFSKSTLDNSWCVGVLFVSFGRPFGSHVGTKTQCFLIEFPWSFFNWFWDRFGLANEAILELKTDLRAKDWFFKNHWIPLVKPYFLRFWGLQHMIKSSPRTMWKSCRILAWVFMTFWAQNESFLSSFWSSFCYLFFYRFFDDFWDQFWRQNEENGIPTWSGIRTTGDPSPPQTPPKLKLY